jgi:hypothetical protein
MDLSKIAVGDEIFIDRGRYGHIDVHIGVVVGKTPAGRIKVKVEECDYTFMPNGNLIGRKSGFMRWDNIITKEQYLERRNYQITAKNNQKIYNKLKAANDSFAKSSNRDQLKIALKNAIMMLTVVDS